MTTFIVPGRLISPTQIELLRPIHVANPVVEVEVREQSADRQAALLELIEFLKSRPPGTRSKEDIDRQLEEERNSWDDRPISMPT